MSQREINGLISVLPVSYLHNHTPPTFTKLYDTAAITTPAVATINPDGLTTYP